MEQRYSLRWERVLLFTVVMGVGAALMLWSPGAPRVPTDQPRKGYLEKEMKENLNLCNKLFTEYNSTSHHYEILKKRLQIMHQYIPAHFSSNFRNPCWYDFHQEPTSPPINISNPCRISLDIWSSHVLAQDILRQVNRPGKRHLNCLPAFFLSGFPKCATTSLHELITQHPLVAKNRCKGNWFWNFFIRDEGTSIYKEIHPLWYFNRLSHSAQYIESNPLSITQDASPIYTLSFTDNFCMLPTLLKRLLPEAKFILIMRNPTKRYFSHYWFQKGGIATKKNNKTNLIQYAHTTQAMHDLHTCTVDVILKFQSCVNGGNSVLYCIINERSSKASEFLYYGLYYYHIGPWLNIIPRDKFLFLRTEDLDNDPSLIMSKVWYFLQVDGFLTETEYKNVDEVIKDIALPQQTKELLDEFYQPYNQLLALLLSDVKYLWKF